MKKFKNKLRILNFILYLFLISTSIYVILDTFIIPNEVVSSGNNDKIIEREDSHINEEKNNNDENNNLEVIITSNSYKDDNISIKITTDRSNDTTYYIADISISSVEYLKTALANNTYGRNIKETTSDIAKSNNAIFAINGDYYGFRDYGYVIRNGILYRDINNEESEALVIDENGDFSIINESDVTAQELLSDGAWQVLSFGPGLIENGEISVGKNEEVAQAKTSNPRTAIGQVDKLHYIIIVADGRTNESEGLSLYELAEIMQEYNCSTAYNLDGGGSSTMYFNGEIINNPTNGRSSGERRVSDIVYIGY